ncbi:MULTISPECIES: hypothetical protein [Vibrio]|nr:MULTISPECIES: hypothetical protein [Vibrio]
MLKYKSLYQYDLTHLIDLVGKILPIIQILVALFDRFNPPPSK